MGMVSSKGRGLRSLGTLLCLVVVERPWNRLWYVGTPPYVKGVHRSATVSQQVIIVRLPLKSYFKAQFQWILAINTFCTPFDLLVEADF